MTDVERVAGACALYPTDGGSSAQQIDAFDAGGTAFDRSVLLYAVARVGDLVAITDFDRDDPQLRDA